MRNVNLLNRLSLGAHTKPNTHQAFNLEELAHTVGQGTLWFLHILQQRCVLMLLSLFVPGLPSAQASSWLEESAQKKLLQLRPLEKQKPNKAQSFVFLHPLPQNKKPME